MASTKTNDFETGTKVTNAVYARFRKLLVKNKAGLTQAASVIAGGLKATKVTYFQNLGEVTDSREDIDHRTRLTAAKFVTDAFEAIPNPAQKHELSGLDGEPLVVNILKFSEKPIEKKA